MEHIIVLSCTNRPNSNTYKVATIYKNILLKANASAEIFDFKMLPKDIAFAELFGNRTEAYAKMLETMLQKNEKFIFVVPEYNGTYPGILKVFLESMSPKLWLNKKVCLVGVSDGRAGNIRGLDHLTGVMQYLKTHVFYNKLPISLIEKNLNENFEFNSEMQQTICETQVKTFLEF